AELSCDEDRSVLRMLGAQLRVLIDEDGGKAIRDAACAIRIAVGVRQDERIEAPRFGGRSDRLGNGDIDLASNLRSLVVVRRAGAEALLGDDPLENHRAEQLLRDRAQSLLVVERG